MPLVCITFQLEINKMYTNIAFVQATASWGPCLTANFLGDFSSTISHITKYVKNYLMMEWVEPIDTAIQQPGHKKRCSSGVNMKERFLHALESVGKIVHMELYAFGARILYTVKLS